MTEDPPPHPPSPSVQPRVLNVTAFCGVANDALALVRATLVRRFRQVLAAEHVSVTKNVVVDFPWYSFSDRAGRFSSICALLYSLMNFIAWWRCCVLLSTTTFGTPICERCEPNCRPKSSADEDLAGWNSKDHDLSLEIV